MSQETQTGSLCQPRGMGWGGRWEGGSKGRKYMVAQTVKHLSTMRETQVRSLSWEDLLEKEMPIHSSTIAWKIPWTEELGRLQFMGSKRVGYN